MFDLSGIDTFKMLEYLVRLMMIFLIMPLHELAHAWTANKLGDYTSKYQGRLTLNPFAHIDLVGALLLFFCGFGWAKPVPVNPMHFKKPSQGMMFTALAGPVSNLIAAFVGILVWQLCDGSMYVTYDAGYYGILPTTMGYSMWMLHCFISININLCLFNLVPVPPLDGSRILNYFLPPQAQYWLAKNEQIFNLVVFALMLTGFLSGPLGLLNRLLFNGMEFITNWIPALV